MDENNKDDVIKNDNNNIEANDQTIEKTETNVVKEEHYKKYSIASIVLGILSIVLSSFFHISILCGIIAIGFGVSSVKSGKKVLSIIGIISGAIGIVLTAVAAINLLSFITSSSFRFITALFEELKKITSLF